MAKGEENEKLFTQLTEIKNHHLTNFVLGQKFLVQKIGTIKNIDLIVKILLILNSLFSLDSFAINHMKMSTS